MTVSLQTSLHKQESRFPKALTFRIYTNRVPILNHNLKSKYCLPLVANKTSYYDKEY